MRAIMLMFDSLNRHFLPTWNDAVQDLPNFRRLQEQSLAFDRCYVGSLPCMPARRELHTGRSNFLHRSWGPLEPFDDSMPEMLKQAGIYTHLVTDHQHYWEDGGATYHTRYSSHEFFRGQEGDPWRGHVGEVASPTTPSWRRGRLWRQDLINRAHMQTTGYHPQRSTIAAGLDFIDANRDKQDWFLQIECFDPHEPFFADAEFRDTAADEGEIFDWPDYRPVLEDNEKVEALRDRYRELLAMCDQSLGRVLDAMDAGDMWQDTALIVCTDHGLLLGEREWYGKNVQPWYNENANTPLYIWDPRHAKCGERRGALVQMTDFAPYLLGLFGCSATPDMQGQDLQPVITEDRDIREAAIFGSYGGHVNVTDGRFVYMRACRDADNTPLEEFTLMPTRIDHRFALGDLTGATLHPPLGFTKNVPVLRTLGRAMGNPWNFGTLLYDLSTDPGQDSPLRDSETERRMIGLLVDQMRANEAPASQFDRLGLPAEGPVTEAHLQIDRQWPQVEASRQRDWTTAPAEDFGAMLNTPLAEIDIDQPAAIVLARGLGLPLDAPLARRFAHLTPWHLAVMLPGITPDRLRRIDVELAQYA